MTLTSVSAHAQVNPENLRYELDEYYFMPDPKQLIYSHFPDDPDLSLRDPPMTLTDFEDLVFLKPSFFKHGLDNISNEKAVVRLEEPELELSMEIPRSTDPRNTSFKFTLEPMGGAPDTVDGVPLARFGMQETAGNQCRFKFRFPANGSYLLTLYMKNTTEKEGNASGMTHSSICEYLIVVDCERPAAVVPFPPCIYSNWGAGENAFKYDLRPQHDSGVIHTEDGTAEIKLGLSKDLSFLTKLKSGKHSEDAMQGHVMYRVVGDAAVFTVAPPEPGEYGLEIYCRDPETDGNTLYNACQYLIICDEIKESTSPLPQLPPNFLGAQPGYKKVGMTLLGDPDPLVKAEGPERKTEFELTKPLVVLSQLIHISDDKPKDCSPYILQHTKDNKLTQTVRMPQPGLYKHQIYAVAKEDQSDNLPCVFNFLISCPDNEETVKPFPKQYSQFKDSCFLHEPLDGPLGPPGGDRSQPVHLKIDVPQAQEVAAVVQGRWTHFRCTDDATSTWEADVNAEKFWGKNVTLVVCANYDNSQTSFNTLLDYTV